MKNLMISLFLLFAINISVSASDIGKMKLLYELTTLDDPAYIAMMNYIEKLCDNNSCESFRLPGTSMAPTLEKNDVVLVNKNAYFRNRPQRGDIMVFKYPRNPSVLYMFRVVGLPGDHIAYYKKILYVNGKVTKKSFLSKYVLNGLDVEKYIEKIFDIEHRILLAPKRPSFDGEYKVPDNSYFVMGDNRDNSNDSRYWGVVSTKYIIGKAIYIIYGTDDNGQLIKKRVAIKL